MLTEQTGDILKITNGIICHQTNYHGTMGGGVAAGIAENLLTPEQYKEYADYCEQAGRTALGTVQFIGCGGGLIVANMFCQDERLAAQDGKGQNITDYDAMRRCISRVRSMAIIQGKRLYFPHKLGCGIAGGNWETVKFILQDLLAAYPVEAYILKRAGK